MSDAQKITMLPLSRLTIDLRISARASLPGEVIEGYAETLRSGQELPPVVAFSDGTTIWVADGILRHAAYVAAGRSAMAVEVRPGTWRDARMYAASANTRHGLQRTSACKRLAILVVLADEQGKTWTQKEVADHCGVSVPLVRAVQALAKGSATPAEVIESKIGWTQGGKMPQARAEVVAADEAKSPAPNRVGPAPKPTPAPTPPPNPPASPSVNPWSGVLDEKRPDAFEPNAKDIEIDDDPEDDDVGDADDDAANRERMLRSFRRAERLGVVLGLTIDEAFQEFLRWKQDNLDFGSKHRRRRPADPTA